MSLVHPDWLKENGVVQTAQSVGWRSIGYDLSVGEIFVPPKSEHLAAVSTGKDVYDIPPMGIAVIRSKERLKMPLNIYADAVPKSSLCEKGLLALNTGVVDPGYEGDIVATILNFSKENLRISTGDPFLRLVFYFTEREVDQPDKFRNTSDRERLVRRYPHFFLDIPTVADKIFERNLRKLFPQWVGWLTLGALVAAIVTLALGGYQLMVVGGQLANEEHVNRARTAEEYSAAALQKVDERAREIAELRERVAVLESKAKER